MDDHHPEHHPDDRADAVTDTAVAPGRSAEDRPMMFNRRAALAMGTAAIGTAAIGTAAIANAAGAGVPGALAITGQRVPRLSPDLSTQQPQLIDALRPEIAGRSTWGEDLPVTGEILAEDDVRFLLVHHTASRNDYAQDEVVDQIRDFYGFHTGPEKGWPDVAYNFFLDRFGGIWEARAGSIDGPVRGDATGGSQGFAMLCSLIGDHSQVEVSPEALDSLTALLAWLAERYRIDTAPGSTVDFVSRGSNRWPVGTEVMAATISGHRDMSLTSCPGDFAYRLVADTLPARVSALRIDTAAAMAATSTTAAAPATTGSATTPTTPPSSAVTSDAPADAAGGPLGRQPGTGNDDDSLAVGAALAGVAATVTAVVIAGAARFRRRAT